MYAIINADGHQRRVSPGDIVWFEKREIEAGDTFRIDNVMLLNNGEETMVGAPFIAGASVAAQALRHVRDRKVLVYKYKRRKGYTRKKGHRHAYVEARIMEIAGEGDVARFAARYERPIWNGEDTEPAAIETPKPAAMAVAEEPIEETTPVAAMNDVAQGGETAIAEEETQA